MNETISMGVFAGIVVGTVTAIIYNYSREWKTPQMFSFFTGDKFVVTLAPIAMIPLGIAFSYIWVDVYKRQVFTQYVDTDGKPTMESPYNPNGSLCAIEGILSADGRVIGKMAHSERQGENRNKNIYGEMDQKIFEAGVKYFKGGKDVYKRQQLFILSLQLLMEDQLFFKKRWMYHRRDHLKRCRRWF